MKKSVIYSVLLLVLLSFSCQNLDKVDKPKNLIEEDKMIEILADIAFVKAAKGSYKKVFDIEKINPESYILEKHGIDSIVFAENNRWYVSELDRYEEIFGKVKKKIEISKIKFEKLKKEEDSIKRINDSIKRAKKDSIYAKEGKKNSGELDDIKEELMNLEMENAVKKRSKSIPAASRKKKQ
ncbi:DUF4296 domain-containing protein [Aquimarina litoralis]|uniref:DUF4296 domain-containing protein n=1 Tax=Aquimarina litoralis TaxID=584605 RepID=UPI001C56B165|nr:DUF4296 domain-containing protein [Aquimarina litoralis]MBW1295300.1 DUF4296 domain-containing protein [Aquimarina litoralis]